MQIRVITVFSILVRLKTKESSMYLVAANSCLLNLVFMVPFFSKVDDFLDLNFHFTGRRFGGEVKNKLTEIIFPETGK